MTVNGMVGAVTDSSAWVRGDVGSQSDSTTLRVADNPGMSGATTFSATVDTEGIASVEATGLDPDTAYWYELDDGDDALPGRFHTHGTVGDPYSFTFAQATCAGRHPHYPGPSSALLPDRVSDHPVFDDIRGQDPLFFIHGGDLHYYNIGSGDFGVSGPDWVTPHRRAYDDVLSTRQGELYRNVPLVYMWDDHDFGPNNSSSSNPSRAAAAQVYRERVPHYDLAESGAVYHSFQVGRILFVVLDIRYYRDATVSPTTMLGSAQKSWLDILLGSSSAEYLVVVQGQNWIPGGISSANWSGYEAERGDLVTMFGDHSWLDRMCMLSGDSHAMAMDTGGGNTAGGFPLFLFSPLDSSLSNGPTYDLGRRGATSGGSRGQYGTVDVADTGDAIVVNGTGWYVGG